MRRLVLLLLALAVAIPAVAVAHGLPGGERNYPVALKQLKRALAEERKALTEPKDAALADLTRSLKELDHAVDNTGGGYVPVATAYEADEIAIRRLKKNDKTWIDIVRIAIKNKKEAIAYVESKISTAEANDCSTSKVFDLYAVPAGYGGSYTDVYPHGIPKTAKNITIDFVDAATGKPAPAEPFPGQTWTASNKGFTTRGGEVVLHVHIDVSGTGIGKPDEKHVRWKVVVTWAGVC